MTVSSVSPQDIRATLLLRREIALLDVRHEAEFATGHPLFAANMAAGRIALEAELRLPRKDVPIVLYDNGEGLVAAAAGPEANPPPWLKRYPKPGEIAVSPAMRPIPSAAPVEMLAFTDGRSTRRIVAALVFPSA